MDAIWTIYDYVSEIGANPVAKWIRKELSTQEESDLDALLKVLVKKATWGWPEYRTIVGRSGLGEIRWPGESRRTLRIIGIPSLTEKTFVCLLGCSHKSDIYKPPDWLDTSGRRKRDLEQGRGALIEH